MNRTTSKFASRLYAFFFGILFTARSQNEGTSPNRQLGGRAIELSPDTVTKHFLHTEMERMVHWREKLRTNREALYVSPINGLNNREAFELEVRYSCRRSNKLRPPQLSARIGCNQ